jgi:hypothetical protein
MGYGEIECRGDVPFDEKECHKLKQISSKQTTLLILRRILKSDQ